MFITYAMKLASNTTSSDQWQVIPGIHRQAYDSAVIESVSAIKACLRCSVFLYFRAVGEMSSARAAR
jgi:hypothetical protein